MPVVITNGVFDILHAGHINLLTWCRRVADNDVKNPHGKVVVLIDSDEKVRKDKGNDRPIFFQEERKNALKSLTEPILINKKELYFSFLIDKVYIFNSNEELNLLIKALTPDFIVKGEDWKNNVIGSDISEVLYFPLVNSNIFSTTKIVQKVNKKL